MLEQPTTASTLSQLQPQGTNSVQSGQGGLQTQSTNATTQSGASGQPQQDVLGLQNYTSKDGLTVQGTYTAAQQTNVTTGKVSSDVFFVLFITLALLAFFVLKRARTTKPPKEVISKSETIEPKTGITSNIKPKSLKKQKKHATNKNLIKKPKSKAKKRKK